MQDETLKYLINKYSNLHPLIVKRTLENTKNKEKSIYILENIPKYPIVWDRNKNKWINNNASINKT